MQEQIMVTESRFAEVVTSEEQFCAVMGLPVPRVLKKEISNLDVHCRAFISRSPFVVISSFDAEGRTGISGPIWRGFLPTPAA